MPDFFFKQLDALTQLDVRKPGALLLYLGILSVLVYQYYRESAEVFREYGRFHREVLKEQSLQRLYTEEWKQRLGAATHLFNLGGWLIVASFLLLFQFVGIMILLQERPARSGGNTGMARSSASPWTTLVVPSVTPSAGGGHGATSVQEDPRVNAQRLLGVGFIVFCVFVVLWMNRMKYEALRAMYEFSNQEPQRTTTP